MKLKKELQVAYVMAAVLLMVGIISYAYAAFSFKAPDQPVRMMFKSVAGNVLFDHKIHTDDGGYGLTCNECHHHPGEEETEAQQCWNCHSVSGELEPLKIYCNECHEPDEYEDSEVTARGDAFHQQCTGCHQEFGSGPGEKECKLCHVL